MVPMSFLVSEMALSGHAAMHALQPMHTSFTKAGYLPFTKTIAFCLQTGAHFPHFVHFEKSHLGIGWYTVLSFFLFIESMRWSLGHSTSASTSMVFLTLAN